MIDDAILEMLDNLEQEKSGSIEAAPKAKEKYLEIVGEDGKFITKIPASQQQEFLLWVNRKNIAQA